MSFFVLKIYMHMGSFQWVRVSKKGVGEGGLWAYGVVVIIFDFHQRSGVRIPVEAMNFHNDCYYTIRRHHWQVSENNMPRVHPSHVREFGKMETAGDHRSL